MPKAFVIMNCDLGTHDFVINEIKAIPGITEVHKLSGVYDIIAMVYSDSAEGLKDATHKMRLLNNVMSSLTLIIPGT